MNHSAIVTSSKCQLDDSGDSAGAIENWPLACWTRRFLVVCAQRLDIRLAPSQGCNGMRSSSVDFEPGHTMAPGAIIGERAADMLQRPSTHSDVGQEGITMALKPHIEAGSAASSVPANRRTREIGGGRLLAHPAGPLMR
jgi:hypothetical protein